MQEVLTTRHRISLFRGCLAGCRFQLRLVSVILSNFYSSSFTQPSGMGAPTSGRGLVPIGITASLSWKAIISMCAGGGLECYPSRVLPVVLVFRTEGKVIAEL